MQKQIEAALIGARDGLNALLADSHARGAVEAAVRTLIATLRRGGKIFSYGNGGSLSDAMTSTKN